MSGLTYVARLQQMVLAGFLFSALSMSAQAGEPVEVSLDSVTVFNDAIAEVTLQISGNQLSRGLQLRLDFDPASITAVNLDDCLAGFIGQNQLGTLCSQPAGQPGRIRILLNAGAGEVINDFNGTLRFQLDGTLAAGETIELLWHEAFAAATNPASDTGLQNAQITSAGAPPGQLALDPSMLDFGAIQFGQSTQAFIGLTNAASANAQSLEVAAFSVSGDQGFAVTDGGSCQVGSVLAPESTGCTVALSFEPGGAGDFAAALTVVTTDEQTETASLVGLGLPATATIVLSDLIQVFTGEPLAPAVSTEPAGLNVSLTFDGLSNLPVEAGSYEVEATIVDENYSGTTTGTFIILSGVIHQDRFEQ